MTRGEAVLWRVVVPFPNLEEMPHSMTVADIQAVEKAAKMGMFLVDAIDQ